MEEAARQHDGGRGGDRDEEENEESGDAGETENEEPATSNRRENGDENEDRRMQLTAQERQWAMDIKQAIADDPGITEPCSDFWIAQLALIDKDNVDRAVERARHLQAFQREYGLEEGNIDYAVSMIREFQQICPEYVMALLYNEQDRCYVSIINMAKFWASPFKANQRNFQIWVTCEWYGHHALNPDFESIRNGFIVLAENEGYDWKKNFNKSILDRLWTELLAVYPERWKKFKNFNTGMFYNILVSMSKAFVPGNIMAKFETGCQFEGLRLDQIYMTPTVEAANLRYRESFRKNLQRRYANEASFVL